MNAFLFMSTHFRLLLFLTMMLASPVAWCTDHEVQCDPDIPSRPRPESGVPGVAMAQGEDQESECDEGEYLDWFKCSPCNDGTYRTRQMARENRYSRCVKCHMPGMYEIVTESCTKTKDTKIMCEDGFYRYEEPGKPCRSHCVRCDICGVGRNMFKNFEGRECSGYNNTICCDHDNMKVVDGICVAMTTTTTTTTPATSRSSTYTGVSELEKNEYLQADYKELSYSRSPCSQKGHIVTLTLLALFLVLIDHVEAS